MSYKMIVTDIDDTLLTPEHTISPKTKEAIINAQKQGVKFVLCSGRPTGAMLGIAKELELDKYEGYIISYNGANIVELPSRKVLFEKMLSMEQIHRIYDLSVEANVGVHTYSETHIRAMSEYKYTLVEHEITGMPIEILTDFKKQINTSVVKAIMVDEHEYLASIEEKVLPFTTDMSTTYSKPFFLEFMNKEVDKGQSLKVLCDKLNILPSEVITFGDAHNDLPMTKYAGMGVAMGNACEEMKAVANFITKSNSEDGIAVALEKFL